MRDHVGALITMIIVTACAGEGTPKNEFMTLDSERLSSLVNKANAGDGHAAYTIAKHYTFGVHDRDSAIAWLRRAAELGNTDACSGLKTYKIDDVYGCKDKNVN